MNNKETMWSPGINGIFPLPLYIQQATGKVFDDVDDELNTLVNKTDFSQREGWNADTHMLSPDPFSGCILHKNDCRNFIKFLQYCVNDYLIPIIGHNNYTYAVTDSWLTKTIKGKYAQEHSHGTADISGVYYIKTTGEDGNLFFDNIHSSACANVLISQLKAKEILPLETGMLILWPGHLKHGTFVNRTDHERISLSFNICLGRRGFDQIYGDKNYD